jgi:hypothetical protein
MTNHSREHGGGVVTILLSWVLGYARWTQFIPMVAAWFVALSLLVALMFGRFALGFEDMDEQSQADFWSSPYVQQAIEGAKESVSFIRIRYQPPGEEFDWGAFIREAWSALALVGFLLSLLLGAFGIGFRPRSLGEKIKIAAMASAGVTVVAMVLGLSFGEKLTSSPGEVVGFGIAVGLLPFIPTCWGLFFSHVVAILERMFGLGDVLTGASAREPEDSDASQNRQS